MNRWVAIAGAAVAAVVLFVLLRPGGGDDDATDTTTTTTPTTTAASTTTGTTEPPQAPPPPQPPAPPPVTVIGVNVRGGTPVGGIKRATVAKNRRVAIVVRSDVADHIHLHGYDLISDVAPGRPARLRFRATVPGRFEVELEERGVQIVDLRVRP